MAFRGWVPIYKYRSIGLGMLRLLLEFLY
uniref:Uncharacterized protein n=1 Tax=Rhizophora mucronata TaxID=61149 RepID=A0A2P2IWR6_RHIMU